MNPAQKPKWLKLQDEINALPGMAAVKDEVQTVVNTALLNKARKKAGLEPETITLHTVLLGSAGTGKTTVAGKMGELYYELGLVSNPKTVNLDRAQLTGPFDNTAAATTKELITANRGKLIFIDEAYTLNNGPTDTVGKQVVDEMMRLAEEYRDDTVIVLAGYDKQMGELFKVNPGLKSRFSRRVSMSDFTGPEKVAVLNYMMDQNKRGFATTSAKRRAAAYAAALPSAGEQGNARAVRNFYDAARDAQASRLVSGYAGGTTDIPTAEFSTFTTDDFDAAAAKLGVPKPVRKVRKRPPAPTAQRDRAGYSRRKALTPVASGA